MRFISVFYKNFVKCFTNFFCLTPKKMISGTCCVTCLYFLEAVAAADSDLGGFIHFYVVYSVDGSISFEGKKD